MAFTAALHTYYAVPDISAVRVEGLGGAAYTDSLAGGARVITDVAPLTGEMLVPTAYRAVGPHDRA